MSTCAQIVNKAIEDYKVNRTITATTWLNILVSLTYIVYFLFYSSKDIKEKINRKNTTYPTYVILVILLLFFMINLIISSFFLSKTDEERKKNDLNIGTQSFALIVLFLLVLGFIYFNRNKYKLKKVIYEYTLNVSAIIIFIVVYVALLITSIEQSKKL